MRAGDDLSRFSDYREACVYTGLEAKPALPRYRSSGPGGQEPTDTIKIAGQFGSQDCRQMSLPALPN